MLSLPSSVRIFFFDAPTDMRKGEGLDLSKTSSTSIDRFRPLGKGEVVRRIEHVREHLVVVEYQLEKLVEKGGELIISAPSPPNVIDGGAWGASVYARIIVQKCIDSMPLSGSGPCYVRASSLSSSARVEAPRRPTFCWDRRPGIWSSMDTLGGQRSDRRCHRGLDRRSPGHHCSKESSRSGLDLCEESA
jgi:hypothetical protein